MEAQLYAGLGGPLWWPVGVRWQRRVAARTRFFDEVTLAAIKASVSQVVIVGAGYDGRALRFSDPGVRFFEVDHPQTQPEKRRRMQALGVRPGTVTYVPHDLTKGDLPGALTTAGHDPMRPTLFICEGLLLYLTRPVIEHLLKDLRACSEPAASLLALSAGEAIAGAPKAAKARVDLQRLLLATIGEPRQSQFKPGELDGVLRSTGWRIARERTRVRAARNGRLILAKPDATETASA